MKAIRKLRMAVIRGIRPSEALFYDSFENIDIKFIYFSESPKSYPIRPKNLELVNLGLKPGFLFDPIRMVTGHYNHRSWVDIENLEDAISDCDIVNITDTFYVWNKQAAEISKKLGKKLVTVIWETVPNHPASFVPPYSFSVRSVVKNSGLFILRSKKALSFTRSVGIEDHRTKVIYKGVDTKMFSPAKKRNSKNINILYVGQLDKSKGIDELLEAFRVVSFTHKNILMTIAGDGPMAVDVKKAARNLPIKYLGMVDYLSLPSIYSSAGIFVSASKDIRLFGFKIWEELFSYTLMEAQASGLPIVATRSGGIPEEVGEGNLLVKPGSVGDLVRALLKLIENQSLRTKMGNANRERALKLFDLKKQAKETEKAILDFINEN